MAETTNATSMVVSTTSSGNIQTTTPSTTIANTDTVNNPPPRVNQQRILPPALQTRFLNPVTQFPMPANSVSVTLNDLRQASSVIGEDGRTVAAFAFKFTNTSTAPVSVELCASLFIDGTDFDSAYPFGGNVAPTDWSIERIKTAHFAPDFDSTTLIYEPNQSNQDSEFFIVKYLPNDGVTHQLVIYYYWRAISNAGAVSPSGTGQ
jgi:hypothetical protein